MGLRARMVAWRTFGCRVEEDGELNGQPLYRLGELRMVLAADGRSFRRVVACCKCGRLRASRRRVTAADLNWSAPELCADCAPGALGPMDLGDLGRVFADGEADEPEPSDSRRPAPPHDPAAPV